MQKVRDKSRNFLRGTIFKSTLKEGKLSIRDDGGPQSSKHRPIGRPIVQHTMARNGKG